MVDACRLANFFHSSEWRVLRLKFHCCSHCKTTKQFTTPKLCNNVNSNPKRTHIMKNLIIILLILIVVVLTGVAVAMVVIDVVHFC